MRALSFRLLFKVGLHNYSELYGNFSVANCILQITRSCNVLLNVHCATKQHYDEVL